ncbi:MAG: aldolase/citrate lyase family protein [Planctomycetaceae bacterium]
MRRSKTLAKLRAGRPVRSVALGGLLNPGFVRHAAHQGFDCIWLDLEHRPMEQREVQAILAFFHLFDIDCMVRVPTLEKTRLYRYLEDGASGIMVPHVSTPEKAHMLAQSLKFPPIGDRGLDGAGLDTDFILQGGPGYTDEANRETFLTVQIETVEAVENVEKIAAVEGVDVLFIGPADLQLRIKHAKNLGWTFEDAVDRVAAAAKKYGKNWGLPVGNAELAKHFYERGARYINYGGDFGAAITMLEKNALEFDQVFKEKRILGQSAEPSADV